MRCNRLLLIVLIALSGPVSATAAQHIQTTREGGLDLRGSDVCYSETGTNFTRRLSGAPCQVGDLAYLNVAFDSDEAANWAETHCDFNRERPPEAMDVYGVLCYLRTLPRR